MKIAVLGASTNSLGMAPFSDPEWTFIGCGGIYPRLPVFDLNPPPWDRVWWAEVHDPRLLLGQEFGTMPPYGKVYVPWLANLVRNGGRVFLKEPLIGRDGEDLVPGADIINREEIAKLTPVIEKVGEAPKPHMYLTNSITYMTYIAYLEAKAIGLRDHEVTIGFWGVDMMVANTDPNQEYSFQRPSCEQAIGFLQGRGVNVVLPPECDILKTAYQYGDKEVGVMRQRIMARKKAIQVQVQQLQAQAQQFPAKIAGLQGQIGILQWIEHSWLPGDSGHPRAPAPQAGANLKPNPAVALQPDKAAVIERMRSNPEAAQATMQQLGKLIGVDNAQRNGVQGYGPTEAETSEWDRLRKETIQAAEEMSEPAGP